jgi:hypothetical protein
MSMQGAAQWERGNAQVSLDRVGRYRSFGGSLSMRIFTSFSSGGRGFVFSDPPFLFGFF